MSVRAVCLFVLCLAVPGAPTVDGQDRAALFSEPGPERLVTLDFDPEKLLNARLYTQAVILKMNMDVLPEEGSAELLLDVLDLRDKTVVLEVIASPSEESRAWYGEFDGGEVTLVLRQGAGIEGNKIERRTVVAGTIRSDDGRVVQVTSLEGDLVLLRVVDVENLPPEIGPIVPDEAFVPVGEDEAAESDPSARAAVHQFDVAVFYTRFARYGAGSHSQIRATIDLAVVETNVAYTQSGVNAEVRLVYVEETADNESGSFSGMLAALQNPSDGRMDEVHVKRNEYNADLVVLICENSSSCGLAYVMATESPGFASWAFSVVNRGCATGYYSFGHEMGHNMGCCHDAANPSAAPIFPDAYGWHFLVSGTEYRTIMAYKPGIRIQRFSNPAVTYLGAPTGNAGSANNRRTINETADTVSAFR